MLSFEPLLIFFIATPLKLLIICLAVLVPIVNAINILTHGFGCNIDLFFSFFYFLSYLAFSLTRSSKNKSYIPPESIR